MRMAFLQILLLSAAIFVSHQSSWCVVGINHDSTAPSSPSSTHRGISQNPSRVIPFHTNPYASARNVAPTLRRRRHLNVDDTADGGDGASQSTTDPPNTTTTAPTPRSDNNSTVTADDAEDEMTLTPDESMETSSSGQDTGVKNVGPLPIYAYVLIACAAVLMSAVAFCMSRRSATREARHIEDVMREFDSYSMSSSAYSSNNGETSGGTAV